jgi:DNA modification methylase
MFSDARSLSGISNCSVDLVVTSPPYPMIEMWDSMFCEFDSSISSHLLNNEGQQAFEQMHRQLDITWYELYRVVKPGGFVCINIGNATRKLSNNFRMYTNNSRIVSKMESLGFQSLPEILWVKTTNAPNKFMGSGMLPSGAYVTQEHEYILIFRKGDKKKFTALNDKFNRNESAIFWEERNKWFSDSWNIGGVKQNTKNSNIRQRNAAYPFELPYRLINMYSMKGDTVLDPFLGTGTTTFAAMTLERNSIGIECDNNFSDVILNSAKDWCATTNSSISKRLYDHIKFCDDRKAKTEFKYKNKNYNFPVISKQETQINLNYASKINHSYDNSNINVTVEYSKINDILEPVSPVEFICIEGKSVL